MNMCVIVRYILQYGLWCDVTDGYMAHNGIRIEMQHNVIDGNMGHNKICAMM